jgi:single-strand DNA-binding protein
MYNKYICVGNLTRDPETKPVNDSGDAVTNLAVAVNNPLSKDEVFYADVQAWGKVGENCNKYLTKGKRVLVEGRLKTNTWTNKEGDNRSKVYVVANSVQFLSPVNENGESGGTTMPKVNSKTNTKQQSRVEEEVEEFDSVPF